jgi:hypothetical protein
MKKALKQVPQIMGSMAMGGIIGGAGAMAAEKLYPGMGAGVSGAASMMPAMGSVAMLSPMVGMMKSAMPKKGKKGLW